jgi:glycosyltransferase involved in cell wall biosynthesis
VNRNRRVAFFTDSFHEVNGVALTSREYVNHAKRHNLPVFSVHAGPAKEVSEQGSITTHEFKRGRVCWRLEHDLSVDFLFLRYRERIRESLRKFAPDLVHVTGPGDAGILGAILAHELKVPLVASWHTNLHEFATRRLLRIAPALPGLATLAGQKTLDQCVRFYRLAKVIFAPNQELVDLLGSRTGRPAFLMRRGIDTELFHPSRRPQGIRPFTIGYVGRLSPEKSVRLFAELEQALERCGWSGYRLLLIGEGSERAWLRRNLRHAESPGILRGEALAQAYASMDAFVFPSTTDTFGNVVLEAMASGVPPIVTDSGGPKFLALPGAGYVVTGLKGFLTALTELRTQSDVLTSMRRNARLAAQQFSWDEVFHEVRRNYELCFPTQKTPNNPFQHTYAESA